METTQTNPISGTEQNPAPLRPPRRLSVPILPEWEGMRLSSILRYKVGLSGTVMRRIKWLEDGILLDGSKANTSVRPQAGQILDILLSDPELTDEIPPVEGSLDIVYEDQDIIVVNKAPGVTVHPGPGHYGDTLGNFLCWHYRQGGIPANLHPVHRLDKGTSGLIVTALHPFAQDQLRQQLHTNEFCRTYLAICQGSPETPEGWIDLPIGRDETSILKRQVRPDGDSARTHYQVLQTTQERSLVQLTLETGRTHQIRVHMASIGHPLIGDFLYGEEDHSLISRPALHSWKMEITHPVTKTRLKLEAPLPEDMKELL